MDGYSIDKIEFGKRIKCAREELKMTQAQFAQLLKTSQTTISKYERGEQLPGIDVLATISKETKKSADWLLFGNETTPAKDEIEPKKWLRYFIDLLTSPQSVRGYVSDPEGDYRKSYSDSIVLNNYVGCKDKPDKWEFFGNDVATISFYGKEMAAFFQKLAAIEMVKDMLPPEQMQILEENAIDEGVKIFQPDILPF